MWNALWIFVGGGLGSLARWGASGVVANRFGETFPSGTLTVNVTGLFIIGLFATATGPEGRWMAPATFRQFFMLGICGGYTTFSTYANETVALLQAGDWLGVAGNILGTNLLCLVGVIIGLAVGRQL